MKRIGGGAFVALVIAVAGSAIAAESVPDPKWMAHCGQNLSARHLAELAVNTYCACMAGLGDDAEMLGYSQKKLESSFPFAHKRCVTRAADKMSTPN